MLPLVLALVCTTSGVLDFAMPRWKADPNMRIEDAYKWTYQAARGGEHAAPDRAAASQWLTRQWQTLGTTLKDEPLWEPMCKDSRIGRLNLRSYRDQGGKPDDLLNAFLSSAAQYRSEPKTFYNAWIELGRRLKKQGFGHLTYAEWQRLDGEMRAKEYPAIHHSETYNKAKTPAYRILTRREMETLRSKISGPR